MVQVHPDAGSGATRLGGEARPRRCRTCRACRSCPRHGTFKLEPPARRRPADQPGGLRQLRPGRPDLRCCEFHRRPALLGGAGRRCRPGRAAPTRTRVLRGVDARMVPWGRRDAVLDWYVASLLVRKQALKCVKHLHPDARAKIDAVLREARSVSRGEAYELRGRRRAARICPVLGARWSSHRMLELPPLSAAARRQHLGALRHRARQLQARQVVARPVPAVEGRRARRDRQPELLLLPKFLPAEALAAALHGSQGTRRRGAADAASSPNWT